MDKNLLKAILQRVVPLKKEINVPEYEKAIVDEAIEELVKEDILIPVRGRKYIPVISGNQKIYSNSSVKVEETEYIVEGYEVSSFELEKKYKVDRFGNELE